MDIRSHKFIKITHNVPLRRVTLALSPQNDYYRRMNQLPKCITPKSRSTKCEFKNVLKCNQTYSIAYIGDSSGSFTISSRKRLIPKLTKRQISKESKLRYDSPKFVNNTNQHTVNQYFRPKPLTPASVKMHDFSQFKYKINSMPNSFKCFRKIQESLFWNG